MPFQKGVRQGVKDFFFFLITIILQIDHVVIWGEGKMSASLLEGDERCRREGWKGRLEDFCFSYGHRSMER